MTLFWLLALTILCHVSHSRPQHVFSVVEQGYDQMQLPVVQRAVPTPSNLTASWTPPLRTRGRYIVDAAGVRFKLKAGNWHGASGTYLGSGDIRDPSNHHAGEQAYQTPLCLDRTPIADIIQSFVDLGITVIRLPFSNEMIHSGDIPPDSALRANPQFRGMTPLAIFDACIAELTKRGLAVILNNHTVKSLWCCGVDVNARWNGAQTEQSWLDDWVFMVRRYRSNARVVGAELYNEVRRDFLSDPEWGSGGNTDWWRASQLAGTRILREANPDILIIVEGINYVGIPTAYTQHYRPELQPVRRLSHTMPVLDKLVYSSHYYAYTGPNATGGVDLGSDDALYRDLAPDVLERTMNQLAFYVANTAQMHYTSPVWISEFGSPGRPDFLDKNRWWWANFTSLLIKYDIDYALWPLTGWQESGRGDLWALNAWDSNGNRLSILDPGDWRLNAYNALADDTSGRAGVLEQVPRWQMLHTALGSMQQSNRLSGDATLTEAGTVQASCPDGLRLAGLSYEEHPAGLCTDATYGSNLWSPSQDAYEVVSSQVHVDAEWARGYTKLQCPTAHFLIGYSLTEAVMQTAVCAQSSRDVAGGGPIGNRTIWFNKDSKLANDRGPWYGSGATAATCNDDELLIGLAYSTNDRGYPAAILCQNFNSSATVNANTNAASSLSLPALLPILPWTMLAMLLGAPLVTSFMHPQ